MYAQLLALAAAVAPFAAAAPASKRQQTALSQNDIAVLQLAHYLENLEYNLYSGGCNNFNDAQYTAAGFPAGFRKGVCVTADQENTHRQTLAQVLQEGGQTPLPECTYKFPYTDPLSFVDTANMVTSVGIGAYLGGAELIMDNPALLTSAASILTTEARHDAFLRAGAGGSPFPAPFDSTVTALWANTLASQFIVSCPQYLPGLVDLPMLQSVSPAPQPHLQPPVPVGTPLEFKWDPKTFFVNVEPSKPLYIAIVNQQTTAPIFQEVQNLDFNAGTGSVPLPDGVRGAAFAALTTFSGGLNLTELSQYGTLAGPTELIIS